MTVPDKFASTVALRDKKTPSRMMAMTKRSVTHGESSSGNYTIQLMWETVVRCYMLQYTVSDMRHSKCLGKRF